MNEKSDLVMAQEVEENIKKICKGINKDSPFYMKLEAWRAIENLNQSVDNCFIHCEESFQDSKRVLCFTVFGHNYKHTFNVDFF